MHLEKSSDKTFWLSYYYEGAIYFHPIITSSVLSLFDNEIFNICNFFNNKNMKLYILSDINNDFPKLDCSSFACSYSNNLIRNSLKCLIDKPTKVTEF